MNAPVPGTIPYFLQEQIRELIIDGTFRPGQPLREQELEKRFAASRGPIREALRLLEVRGLVSHIPRRGFRVKLYTDREIRDHYMLRAELEAFAIQQLAEAEDLRPLLAELERCRTDLAEARAVADPRRYLHDIRAFYSTISAYTGNAPLCEVLQKLNDTIEPLRYNVLARKLGESQTLSYTRRIIDALAERHFDEAARAKRTHVMANLPNIIAAYAEARYPGADKPQGG
ncbi:GntR family transcriptional regulator [Bordetella sp. BOR01]|uniref:GntR family transcriptional regulator n=1 Tax=Bordetella sp. BOR01 TaxID=2854779 RepID=UPI001C46A055|nr:GntR family transcriptional regulator [Bordetella sp. BOR01]MBV7484631.1 GntR family transcriptional regulator [Bordetella sp. BOR01]